MLQLNNFSQRLLTGILFVVAIIGGMWWHAYSYLFIFTVAVILGMLEFVELLKARPVKANVACALVIGVFWHLASFCVFAEICSPYLLVVIVPLIMSVFVFELFRKQSTPLLNIASTLLIPFYVALPFSFMHLMVFYEGVYSYRFLLCFFLLVWANDSGAYLVGVNFGRRRLFPRISPKKSWEGAIGGAVLTLLVGYAFSKWTQLELSLMSWMIISLIITVMGTLGDLVESMLKRSVNIKDSGSLLPGHGGVLDRFDAVIFSAPMVATYLILIHFLNYNV